MSGQHPVLVLLIILGLSALPFLLIVGTAFMKTYIVLTVLKNAFGAVQLPPAPVVFGIAVLFALVIMKPVADDVIRETGPLIQKADTAPLFSQKTLQRLSTFYGKAQVPYRKFLGKHTHTNDLILMTRLSNPKAKAPKLARKAPMLVLLPAFLLSELTEAFLFGLLLLLPFLVLDLVVAHVLTAVGTAGLNPTWVSLPFKLLLFLSVDGWSLLTRGLMLSYR